MTAASCCSRRLAAGKPSRSPRRANRFANNTQYASIMAKSSRAHPLLYPVRIMRVRPRLFAAIALALVVMLALQASNLPVVTRLLLGWDAGMAAYLVLFALLMGRSSISDIRRHACELDEGRIVILVLTVIAALASLVAIVAELGSGARSPHAPAELLLASATIVLSWFFIHSIFALHYAHEFYGERGGNDSGLNFPGDEEPDYWDFVYFSFVIGMTFQVSDVAISAKSIRHVATVQGIVAFFFNVTLLALVVNMAASAI
jgi:uncharacterized membrane protein